MSLNKALVDKANQGEGFLPSGDIGGIQKNLYFTPDGRRILAVPAIRDYVIKDEKGNMVRTGTRDANLRDKGWLLEPPRRKQLYCPTCDKWHKKPAEVQACANKQAKFLASMEKRAKDERAQEQETEMQKLRAEINELRKMLQEALLPTKV